MTFEQLGVIPPILKALESRGYTHPTPIQEQSIPHLLAGKDLLGCAQTGTGKTASFAIPILQGLYAEGRRPKGQKAKIRALVVSPTRELASQIAASFTAYGKHTKLYNTVVFGGVKQGTQVQALRRGVDILVATPGRLLDLMNQGFISLRDVRYFVLDEADHMLDMGFIHDIRRIIAALPTQRQSLFFSATMPPAIVELANTILTDPVSVTIKAAQPTAERVKQSVYFVAKKDKSKLLLSLLEDEDMDMESTLVFSRTKHGADKIVKILRREGHKAEAIHGNKTQSARQKALGNFKRGKTNILVATDIAARGIDVSDLSHVVNYDLPNVPETYIHRIGRTGRAGASGIALSFCNGEERSYLRDIQKLIKLDIDVVKEHDFVDEEVARTPVKKSSSRSGRKPFYHKKRKRNSSGRRFKR